MAQIQPKELKRHAAGILRTRGDSLRRIVLLYTGATVAVSIAVSALQFILDARISGTGGLGGLGTRSLLQTAQTVLNYMLMIFTPIWTGSFLLCMMRAAAGFQVDLPDMKSGFRRFGPLLGLSLWRIVILFLTMFAVINISSVLFMLTPFSNAFIQAIEPYMTQPELMEAADLSALLPSMWPMLLLCFAVGLPLILFLDYGMRLAPYLIMRDGRFRALSAIFASFSAMRGHKWKLLRLDLSWWWFYLLEALLAAVCYLDQLLPLLGITLPFDATTAYFVSFLIYGLLELGLHWWKKADVELTFAQAFHVISAPLLEQLNILPKKEEA